MAIWNPSNGLHFQTQSKIQIVRSILHFPLIYLSQSLNFLSLLDFSSDPFPQNLKGFLSFYRFTKWVESFSWFREPQQASEWGKYLGASQWRKRQRVARLRPTRHHVVGLNHEQAASILWIHSSNSENPMSRILSEIDRISGWFETLLVLEGFSSILSNGGLISFFFDFGKCFNFQPFVCDDPLIASSSRGGDSFIIHGRWILGFRIYEIQPNLNKIKSLPTQKSKIPNHY